MMCQPLTEPPDKTVTRLSDGLRDDGNHGIEFFPSHVDNILEVALVRLFQDTNHQGRTIAFAFLPFFAQSSEKV